LSFIRHKMALLTGFEALVAVSIAVLKGLTAPCLPCVTSIPCNTSYFA
jgi:hypothetical protein